MILFSHPAIDPKVSHAVSALNRAGILGEFWTCSHADNAVIHRVSAPAITPDDANWSYPCNGMRPFVGRLLDTEVAAKITSAPFSGVYACEGAADATFRAASRRGLLKIYDLPLGTPDDTHPILQEEADCEPDWAATLWDSQPHESASSKVVAELRQADLVLVASTFGLSVLEPSGDVPGTIAVIPPGAPPVENAIHTEPSERGHKLRVLYRGSLRQRAGLSYLFRACRALGDSVELTVVGSLPRVECRALESELAKVRWIPTCDFASLRQLMSTHDVFLYPSIFEDGGTVMLEAMSMGLPVIATANSAAPDFISDGREGFIIPIRSTDHIVHRLELLHRDPDYRFQMARCARSRAAAQTWDSFEKRLVASVTTALRHHLPAEPASLTA